MIAKTFITAKGFGESCDYVCQDLSRAFVLKAEGVREYDARAMAEDFEWQHGLMPGKEKPVYHCVLSFASGEGVPDARLVELGERFLEKIGMVQTQYVLVKHTDTEHLHVHILANRVDNDGEVIGQGLIVERGIKAAQELTAEYGLRPDEGKRLDRTHREALHEPDQKRYRIYEAIQEVLPHCRGMGDLEKELMGRGIMMRYKQDASSGEQVGVSFRLENRSFKGSRVDDECSLRELRRTLELQEELRQQPRLFEGRDFGERVRLMRDEGSRDGELARVKEVLRLEETQRLAEVQRLRLEELQRQQVRQEPTIRRGLRHGF